MSPYPDPAALDSDALSFPWKGIWGYVYPPTSILPQILNKVRLRGLQDHVDCSSISEGVVVQPTPRVSGGDAKIVTHDKDSSQTTKIQDLSQSPRVAGTSRVDLIQQAMRTRGFSERSAVSITSAVRVSTRAIYDAKWKIFVALRLVP